jgi:hypothetical protein
MAGKCEVDLYPLKPSNIEFIKLVLVSCSVHPD